MSRGLHEEKLSVMPRSQGGGQRVHGYGAGTGMKHCKTRKEAHVAETN